MVYIDMFDFACWSGDMVILDAGGGCLKVLLLALCLELLGFFLKIQKM